MCRHEGHVRTWGEDGHRLAEEKSLRRNPPCPHLALGVPPPELRKINSCCLSPLGLWHLVTAALLCPLPSTQEAQGGSKSCRPPRSLPPPTPEAWPVGTTTVQGGRGDCGQSWRHHVLWGQEGPWRRAGLVPASAGCHGNQGPATTTAGRGEGLGPRVTRRTESSR